MPGQGQAAGGMGKNIAAKGDGAQTPVLSALGATTFMLQVNATPSRTQIRCSTLPPQH